MFYGGRRRGRTYRSVGLKWVCWNEGTKYRNYKKTPSAASASNNSFVESIYYSFNTPVMKYHDGPNGKYVLITSEKYSPTTNAHIYTGVHSCTVPAFRVPFIGATGAWSAETMLVNMSSKHEANIFFLWQNVIAMRDRLIRRFKDEGLSIRELQYGPGMYYASENWRARFNYLYNDVHSYQHRTGVELPPGYMPIDEMIEYIGKVRQEKWNEYQRPQAVAKRERARARKLLNKALGHD